MNIIEKSVNDWMLLQEMANKQIEMNKILLTNKLKTSTKIYNIVDYFVNKNQIVLIKDDSNLITFNLNVHPTITY
jgi:hypothetical protein